MFKLMLALAFVLSATACSAAEASPTDLNGTWTSGPNSDTKMQAVIENGEITIDIVTEGTHALYWKGDFPETAKDDTVIVSQGDVEAMEFALFASLLEEKDFEFENNMISYEYGIMGVTQVIQLAKE